MLTGIAVRLGDEAHKGCRLAAALAPGWGGWRRCQLRRDTVAGPRPMEHEAQPHQGDQHQLVKKEMGDHGKTPSCRWRNEGILPGFSGYRINRRLQVHDLFLAGWGVGNLCLHRFPGSIFIFLK